MTVEDSVDSLIRSLTRVVDGGHALPNHMVRDVRDMLVLIRDAQLQQRAAAITPRSIHADHHRLRVVK